MSENAGTGGNGNKRVYDEETFTLDDVLEAESHWEETTNAVLGASDNKNCSYQNGYVKRQALYACLTCTPPSAPNFKPAGICLACSLNCHDGHDLVELYTKRNFRCDCGNQKFPDNRCKLNPDKDWYNTENSYNHNFSGLYCICKRPYPDPDEEENDDEDEEEDEMIQCVVCEDWLHGRHSKNGSFDFKADEFSEFICESCSKKCGDILGYYGNLMASNTTDEKLETDSAGKDDKVDEGLGCSPPHNAAKSTSIEGMSSATGTGSSNLSCEVEDATSQDSGRAASTNGNVSDTCDEESQGALACLLENSGNEKTDIEGGTWWCSGWRSKLCKCDKCLENYKKLNVSFLLDYEDTLAAYEAKGKANGVSSFETSQQILNSALSKLGHVQQIEVIHGFNEMKSELEKFLRSMAESDRVVTPADIKTFFAGLESKRRKVDSGDYIPPNTCR